MAYLQRFILRNRLNVPHYKSLENCSPHNLNASTASGDILKYFNWNVNYDKKVLQLDKAENVPLLSEGEEPLQIYTIEGVEK